MNQKKIVVSVLGLPLSGKTTFTSMYPERAIQAGQYVRSLPDNDSMKRECIEHWKTNTPLSYGLNRKILQSYPYQEADWYLLDGYPRDAASLAFTWDMFDFRALIEVVVDVDVWLERARVAVQHPERMSRKDSTLSQLVARRDFYLKEMKSLRDNFPMIYEVDNSGDIELAKEDFRQAVSEIFPSN